MSFLPQSETQLVAGRTFNDTANLIVLTGHVNGAVNVNSTMRKAGASSGYQVPAGKTFKCVAVQFMITVAGQLSIAQSDNDCGIASSTAMTNPVYPGGSSHGGVLSIAGQNTAALYEVPAFDFPIATGKYVTIYNSAGSTDCYVRLYGYEV